MNDRDAFIAAIIADPTNDMPRLVFADWLDEHDEPERAEFIRAQFYELKRDESDHTDYVGRSLNKSYLALRWIAAGFGDWTWNGNGGDGIGVVADNGVELIYRRGFVADVYCPLSVWIGVTCGHCNGEQRVGRHYDPASDTMRGGRTCGQCHGLGRYNAHGPRLVREHPLEVVRATDREPLQTRRQPYDPPDAVDWFRWEPCYRHVAGTLAREDIPIDVFKMMWNPDRFVNAFPTREAAQAALSDALIVWAKSQQPVEAVK